jgi:ferredoxin
MKVTVDEDRCAGHGMCLTLCPEVFEMTDSGWAIADPREVPVDLERAVNDAITNCPERAITEIRSQREG